VHKGDRPGVPPWTRHLPTRERPSDRWAARYLESPSTTVTRSHANLRLPEQVAGRRNNSVSDIPSSVALLAMSSHPSANATATELSMHGDCPIAGSL